MKLLVRASILSLAAAGLVAGFMPVRSTPAQAAVVSHQVVSGMMPYPICGPETCNIRGGEVGK